LMVAGDPEGLTWIDRAVENPSLLPASDLVEALVTRGTLLLQVGRVAEGEVVLRGAMVVADRKGFPWAGLRARNNLQGVVELTDMEEGDLLARESLEIAERFGLRTWALQAIGVGVRLCFDLGRWDDWLEEVAENMPADQDNFYRLWYEGSLADRLAYRGRADDALQTIDRALGSQAVKDSLQAQAGLSSQKGDILMAQQRWSEAFDATRAGWNHSDMSRYALTTAMLAAAALADVDKVKEAAARLVGTEGATLPAGVAKRHIADALVAALEGRWDEARASYLGANRVLEGIGDHLLLARFQLALSHLAAQRFAEADEAGREADAFFTERGAASYVEGYRANAAKAPPSMRVAARSARDTAVPTESPRT
jgi:tetratricopeptide (TPR) repeat protein